MSGGGLLSGVATAIKLTSPGVQVWGTEPELAADAKESFDTRTLVEGPPRRPRAPSATASAPSRWAA